VNLCFLSNINSIHTQRWAKHFVAQGHNVSVISFQSGEIEGIDAICLTRLERVPSTLILSLLPKIRSLCNYIQPDILHAHYATSYGLSGALCNYHPFVVTAWGDDILVDPERSLAYRLLVRLVMSRADMVTSMAGHMTELIVKRGYAERERILTLPFGVDTDLFNPTCRRSKSSGNGITVISTRHLEAVYDVETLIRAVPAILAKLPDTRFRIVGTGALRPALERLAVTLNIHHAVDFLGAVDHNRLVEILAEADIFVTTSKSDGNNISLNEAMACGALPVASDIPANREWLTEGLNGLFFPVGDAARLASQVISAALRPEWRRHAAEENWRIIQERGSWKRNMHRMEKAYKQMLGMI